MTGRECRRVAAVAVALFAVLTAAANVGRAAAARTCALHSVGIVMCVVTEHVAPTWLNWPARPGERCFLYYYVAADESRIGGQVPCKGTASTALDRRTFV